MSVRRRHVPELGGVRGVPTIALTTRTLTALAIRTRSSRGAWFAQHRLAVPAHGDASADVTRQSESLVVFAASGSNTASTRCWPWPPVCSYRPSSRRSGVTSGAGLLVGGVPACRRDADRRRSASTRSPISSAAADTTAVHRHATACSPRWVTFGEGYHSLSPRFPFDYRNGVRLVAVGSGQVAHLVAGSRRPRPASCVRRRVPASPERRRADPASSDDGVRLAGERERTGTVVLARLPRGR